MSNTNQRRNHTSESVLGIVPVSHPQPLRTELTPYVLEHPVTHDEKRITEEFRKQTLVIEGEGEKTVFGQDIIGEIHDNAQEIFVSTIKSIFEAKQEAKGTEYQSYVDEFTTLNAKSLAKHLYGSVEVGAAEIGIEISRSLYPPPEPLSLWKRLFG
jgi:hypothetical protein